MIQGRVAIRVSEDTREQIELIKEMLGFKYTSDLFRQCVKEKYKEACKKKIDNVNNAGGKK